MMFRIMIFPFVNVCCTYPYQASGAFKWRQYLLGMRASTGRNFGKALAGSFNQEEPSSGNEHG